MGGGGQLLHTVRTGDNAFEHAHGVGIWEYRESHPEEGALFDRNRTASSPAATVVAAYDFSRFGRIIDVGGGQGALLTAILSAHTNMRGVLFDQPHVVAAAEPVLQAAGVADRCDVVGGSFFEGVPPNGDAYVLQAILNSFDDEAATSILRTCRAAMGPTATLLIVEALIGPPNEGQVTKFADLQLLLGPGGQTRTREEFASLFRAGGFRLARVAEAGRLAVVEGVPA